MWVRKLESLAEDWEELLDSGRDVVLPNRGQSGCPPPPRKWCIQLIWRVRDHPPSPIDLWPQGMTACFLVSSVLFMSTGKCASICLCVFVAGGGEKAGHQDKDVGASDSPLCSATVQTASKCIRLGCHSGLTTRAPHSPRSSLGYGVDTVYCRPKKPFPFSTPFFPINRNWCIQGAGGIAGWSWGT